MKKLDLHIHTKKTISDVDFNFSIDRLVRYVEERKLDGIAITNHNVFDIEQYRYIRNRLSGVCEVLPGIEINIGINGFGHLLCIADPNEVDEFAQMCKQVEVKVEKKEDKISLEELKQIFIDLGQYLLIPHYEKEPRIEKEVLNNLKEYILCGEVGSVKKFIYCKKSEHSLVPVYFSDYRPSDNDEKEFPTRQTFFDVKDVSIQDIKRTLLSKKHVSLTEEESSNLFYIMPGLKVSTGLNVIMGGRSSGKTYTLDKINQYQENVKYIKQFELVEINPERAAKDFTNSIKEERSNIVDEYLSEFKSIVDEVKEIDIDYDEKKIENYITSLIKYAKEQDRVDAFAKCKLFSENKFVKRNLNVIKDLIDSVDKLIEAKEYRELIDSYVSVDVLKELYKELVDKAIQETRYSLEENWVNNIVQDVKQALSIRSASNRIEEVDFYDVQMNRNKIEKFNELVSELKKERIIKKFEKGDFLIRISRNNFQGASDLKSLSGKVNVRFSDIFNDYIKNPYRYLIGLKDMPGIAENEYYKYFTNIQYEILNKYGAKISGGERAEFKLLNEIDEANRYDMLLIDEPEASFDNIFLKEKVNSLIKHISMNMPVIIVTHNNTVGASIKPDYIIYTERVIDNEQVIYERYCGLPSSKKLSNNEGKEKENIDVMLNCLEAGRESYEDRRRDYEILDN